MTWSRRLRARAASLGGEAGSQDVEADRAEAGDLLPLGRVEDIDLPHLLGVAVAQLPAVREVEGHLGVAAPALPGRVQGEAAGQHGVDGQLQRRCPVQPEQQEVAAAPHARDAAAGQQGRRGALHRHPDDHGVVHGDAVDGLPRQRGVQLGLQVVEFRPLGHGPRVAGRGPAG